MHKVREICDPTSCINQAESEEPVFVLRAHDENASRVVLKWADWYVTSKGGWLRMTEQQRAKYQEAIKLAQEMEDYARARGWRP